MAQVLKGGILFLFVVLVACQGQEGTGGCAWDIGSDLEQGLETVSFDNGARNLAHLPEITDMEGCQRACCNHKECQLAMIGRPADGVAQCFLVSCMKDDQDVCVLGPSTQFQVYRKTSERQHTPRIDDVAFSDSETRGSNSTDACLQPMVVGMCRAALPRFYYQASSGSCKPFIYGGCNANGNNFLSQEECERNCSGVTGPAVNKHAYPGTPGPAAGSEPGSGPKASPRGRMSGPLHLEDRAAEQDVHKETQPDYAERCQAKPEVGPCRASMRRFHYDIATETCRPFIFGGCNGNENNYMTEDQCTSSCKVSVSQTKKHPAVVSQQYIDDCVVPYQTGPCRASFSKFYFDSADQTCRSFTYGGCGGNRNRYSTKDECLARCAAGDNGHSDLLNADSHGWWVPALFVVGILVALTVLALAGLIVVTGLRNRCQRIPSHGDKEELLTRQTSLEALTQDKSPKVCIG